MEKHLEASAKEVNSILEALNIGKVKVASISDDKYSLTLLNKDGEVGGYFDGTQLVIASVLAGMGLSFMMMGMSPIK